MFTNLHENLGEDGSFRGNRGSRVTRTPSMEQNVLDTVRRNPGTSVHAVTAADLLLIYMDCNRLLLLLIRIQLGLSQLSFKKILDTQNELVQQNGFFQNVQVLDAKEFTDCESLGFRNATKNACGFCAGGNTKLSDRYFIDCTGKCNGNSFSDDCNGDCLGTAYVDQCSGECIGKYNENNQ
ncbi:hypothetical protein TNCV_2771981 [Trichonephila clavipes]|nr:hypothetical protein TNCV_2771981 [Trichonephila clavipes]